MKRVGYEPTGDARAPAIIRYGEYESPVWIQQLWDEGEYALYVRKNGCGHCCVAMALNLHGINIDPHEEYALCRELWGAPDEGEGYHRQGNFQSISGMAKILAHHGVRAECHGVSERRRAIAHIEGALGEGKLVIFESHFTDEYPDNPFSTSEHWVMALGYAEDGKIIVANSSNRMTPEGIQLVTAGEIARALYLGSSPEDMTWGEWRDDFLPGTGYIIVG